MTDTINNVSTRLLIACLITAEIRMHLNYSIEWKHAALDASSAPPSFREVRLHGKDYFGFYIEHKSYKINELDEIQYKIRTQLKSFCPKLDTETLDICIIPQVFVA